MKEKAIKILNQVIEDLEYGDITKNSTVRQIEKAIEEIESDE